MHNTYLGVWFPRTSLHLNELYRFLKYEEEIAGLDIGKLHTLREALRIERVAFHEEAGSDYLEAVCGDVTFTFGEDGMSLLRTRTNSAKEGIARLSDFFTHNYWPALHYLFSSGAPISRGLISKTPLQFVHILENGTEEEVESIYVEENLHYESVGDSSDTIVYFGSTLTVLNRVGTRKTSTVSEKTLQTVDRLIFFREFENQLHYYLNLHRKIWNDIASVRESANIRFRDFAAVREKILGLQKTLLLVEARLRQMDNVLLERQGDETAAREKSLRALGLWRYNHLHADHAYILNQWNMTIQYAEGTLKLLESLFSENSSRELNVLKYVTLLTAVTSFFGMNVAFPWEVRWPELANGTYIVLALMSIFSLLCYVGLRYAVHSRRFSVKEGDF